MVKSEKKNGIQLSSNSDFDGFGIEVDFSLHWKWSYMQKHLLNSVPLDLLTNVRILSLIS